jgi:hypothetical protein
VTLSAITRVLAEPTKPTARYRPHGKVQVADAASAVKLFGNDRQPRSRACWLGLDLPAVPLPKVHCRVLAELRHAPSIGQNVEQSVWVTNAHRGGHCTRRARCRPSDVKRKAAGELRPNRPSGSEEGQRAARRRPSDSAVPGLGLGVGELRNNVELLHHPERVPVGVLLDHLAVC